MPVWLIPWLIRGALVLGVVLTVAGVVVAHDNKVRAAEAAKWRPKVEACERDRDAAVAANAQLQDDLAKLQATYAKAQAALDDLAKREAAAQKTAAEALARLAVKEASLRAEIERLRAIAGGPPAPTRTEACDEADRILRGLADERVHK